MATYGYEATSRTLETDHGEIHYHEAGDGPVLLLLHGAGPGVSGWANFEGNLPVFAEHFRTIVPDMPGFGASPPWEGGHPYLSAVDATLDVIERLDLGAVRIVGNSMGGAIGAHIGIHRPELLQRLVTIGGVGLNIFSPTPAEGINLAVEFMENPSREAMVAWLRSMVYDPSMVTDDLVDQRMKTATDPTTVAWSRKIFSAQAMADNKAAAGDPPAPPAWTLLHRLHAPTLVTWGRDDRVTPLDGALLPMRVIPRGELHVFHDCGHWAMIERKEEFESVVLAFLLREH